MNTLSRILLISFLESFANMLLMRGVFFYAEHVLGWTWSQNLWLALVGGACYVAGALPSHRISQRLGERKLLLCVLLVQIGCMVVLLLPMGMGVGVVALMMAYNALTGLKWPVVESDVSAGRDAKQTARAVGTFNLVWSSAVGAAVLPVGLILATWSSGLFVMSALISLAAAGAAMTLHAHPIHTPHDHISRPSPRDRATLTGLMRSARWSLLGGYTFSTILVALLPILLKNLDFTVEGATTVASLMDWSRFGMFALLFVWTGWHGRRDVLVLAAVGLPLAFYLVLMALGPAWVVAGLIAFGIAMGLAYYTSLYYGMVVNNASVDAGGTHEALIGAGFTIGPAAALLGTRLALRLDSTQGWGTGLGVLPLAVLYLAGALLPLLPQRDTSTSEPSSDKPSSPAGP